ncbi:MAG: hypothetical protein ACPGU1_04820 [Myxococcota bacterium]
MRLILPILLTTLLTAPACEKDANQIEIAESLNRIVTALDAANWSDLWDESHPDAQDQVLQLHTALSEALDTVSDLYERSEQPIARAALGRDLVADIAVGATDAGPRLLSRLFASGAIRLDEKTRDGLTASSAAIDGDRAVVHTAAGEIFTFGRADGRWKSRLLVDMLDQSRPVTTLKESALAVAAAKKAQQDAWASSRDPKTPHGAYNLARSALERTPLDASVVYALLAPDSRAALLEALKLARQAQSRLQKRTTKSQRKAAYAKHGLTVYVGADSDRALYEAWSKMATYVPPVTDASKPASVERGESDTAATVVTTSGKRVPFARGEDDVWRLTGNLEPIRTALVAPAKATLKKLGGGE